MSKSRHTEAQMIGALKQVEAGRKVEDVAREVGVSKHTLYAWKAKYGGMDVSQAQEAKQLRDENTKLRKLVADLSLDKEHTHKLRTVISPDPCCWRDCLGFESPRAYHSFRWVGRKLSETIYLQFYPHQTPTASP
jgi:putative transposase